MICSNTNCLRGWKGKWWRTWDGRGHHRWGLHPAVLAPHPWVWWSLQVIQDPYWSTNLRLASHWSIILIQHFLNWLLGWRRWWGVGEREGTRTLIRTNSEIMRIEVMSSWFWINIKKWTWMNNEQHDLMTFDSHDFLWYPKIVRSYLFPKLLISLSGPYNSSWSGPNKSCWHSGQCCNKY